MSATQQPEPETAEPEEPGEQYERTARLVLILVAGLALWGLLAAFPYLAYVMVGVLGTVGWQRARSWFVARGNEPAEPEQETPALDVGEALRRLVGNDNGVLLTRLRDDLKLPDTKRVKALLDAEDITWKAVRTPHGNGPGVHKGDIPADPSPVTTDAHGNGCCCRSGDNNNTDNSDRPRAGEGIRVERTDDGLLIYDLAEQAGTSSTVRGEVNDR
ncbi:hypothetical protein ABZT17_12105 [Streptomyces sp. NPDC005648]|uniref:hypothetical protein n=1 Tax=Streptomyces sp. NPDC005648 TaxID=3157044 RepID=UPI0033A4FC97